jgi:hypothetical protein
LVGAPIKTKGGTCKINRRAYQNRMRRLQKSKASLSKLKALLLKTNTYKIERRALIIVWRSIP